MLTRTLTHVHVQDCTYDNVGGYDFAPLSYSQFTTHCVTDAKMDILRSLSCLH